MYKSTVQPTIFDAQKLSKQISQKIKALLQMITIMEQAQGDALYGFHTSVDPKKLKDVALGLEKYSEITQFDPDVYWGFVENWYPHYDSCDTISYGNDLRKIVDGELNGEAKRLWEEEFNCDIKKVKKAYQTIHQDIYERAIENFVLENNEDLTNILEEE